MKPHRTDVASLLFGLIFLAAVVFWLVDRHEHRALPSPGWVIAGALIVFGAVGLLVTFVSASSRQVRAGNRDERGEPDDR